MYFKVFVSDFTHDLSHVEKLQQQLIGNPVELFVAEHSVTPSQDLAQSINIAIEQCDLFVLIWSKNAEASAWVPQEIGKATALKKTILPLVLDEGLSLPGFIQNSSTWRSIVIPRPRYKKQEISSSAHTNKKCKKQLLLRRRKKTSSP